MYCNLSTSKRIKKTISLLIILAFLFTNTSYATDLSHTNIQGRAKILRVPLIASKMLEKEELISFPVEGIPEFTNIESKEYGFRDIEILKPDLETEINQDFIKTMQVPAVRATARKYDLRGHVKVFTSEVARAYFAAQAYLAFRMGDKNNRKAFISSDQEEYNTDMAEIAVDEFQKAGFEVIYSERPITSPLAYMCAIFPDFAVDNIAYASASHNPDGDTGIKIGITRGTTFGPYGVDLVWQVAKRGLRVKEVSKKKDIRKIGYADLERVLDYYYGVHKRLGIEFDPNKVHFIVNPILGTTGYDKNGRSTFIDILKRYGVQEGDCKVINREIAPSAQIPGGYQPNPELPGHKAIMNRLFDKASKKKRYRGKFIGSIAFDRDGDRLGTQITADKMGILAVRQLAENYRIAHPEDKRKLIVYVDGKCSMLAYDDPVLKHDEYLNVEVRPTMTGHSYLKWHLRDHGRKVKETGELVLAAFEQSGHCFYKLDPADPNSPIVEDPLALYFAVLQYLQKKNMTLEEALNTLAPYVVGTSVKFYLNAENFIPEEAGQLLSDRKYQIMEEVSRLVHNQLGKLVVNGRYKINSVKNIDSRSIRIFFADSDDKNFIGSVTFRPSDNEEVLTINIDCIKGVEKIIQGITPEQFIKDIQNFVVFDLSAANFNELTTLYPTKNNKKLGILGSNPMTGEDMMKYALANGWDPKEGINRNISAFVRRIKHKETDREVVIKFKLRDVLKDIKDLILRRGTKAAASL
jgi:phosphomannomutase